MEYRGGILRTIAGQIQNYSFTSASAGVNDPTFGNNVEAIFENQWQTQIENNATVQARNFDGNEHLGADFSNFTPFPDLQDDVPLAPGSVLTFEYPIDVPISTLNAFWSNGETTPAGTFFLTVHMDDALHLEDQFGKVHP